ncbi:uncharacterized protein LOC122668874 isoform X2 [Telopea speciosissima]|uniref:uncharacterized protein LOC122668874 isoform X2 n=1 Tax=Telopea speciosissima TaxID=54955 RepID=UPI001CC5697A|nr:uncharacterized protein LOC122668874 isoform X2 [Telopea speciosissima]
MAITKESTPLPVIGKAGRYTVFITPPATPKGPKVTERAASVTPKSESSLKIESPKKVVAPPPVQPPPQQFEKPASSNSSVFGIFWNAVAKVQKAHSSLDEHLADWFGLNHSRYQWALNDYYESRGMGKEDAKPKDLASKGQTV